VHAVSVMVALDISEQRLSRLGLCRPSALMDQFDLEGVEEARHRGVIVATTGAAHRRCRADRGQMVDIGTGCILRTTARPKALDIAQQGQVRCRSSTWCGTTPIVIAAAQHAGHAAHDVHRPDGRMLLDKACPEHVEGMPTAFFRMSRSIRARSGSRRNRTILDAWSAGNAIVDTDGFAAGLADEALLSCNLRCQRRSVVGIIPNSAATSLCIRPLVSHNVTASRLNASVNRRFVVIAMIHLLAPQSLSSVSVKPGEDQIVPHRWHRPPQQVHDHPAGRQGRSTDSMVVFRSAIHHNGGSTWHRRRLRLSRSC